MNPSQHLNLSHTLHHFVSSFKYMPANASNLIKETKLKVNVGQVYPQQFLHFMS
jgi:hypothetical protein